MATKNREPQNIPLADRPLSKTFEIRGPTSAVSISVSAAPALRVSYHIKWLQRPQNGTIAVATFQVTLLETATGRRADRLATVRALSDGHVYGGVAEAGGVFQQLRAFQLQSIDDFEIAATISESDGRTQAAQSFPDDWQLEVNVLGPEGSSASGANVELSAGGTAIGSAVIGGDGLNISLSPAFKWVDVRVTGSELQTRVYRGSETRQEVRLPQMSAVAPRSARTPTARCPDGTTGQPCVDCIIGGKKVRICA